MTLRPLSRRSRYVSDFAASVRLQEVGQVVPGTGIEPVRLSRDPGF
jgi:hypothetical protein